MGIEDTAKKPENEQWGRMENRREGEDINKNQQEDKEEEETVKTKDESHP